MKIRLLLALALISSAFLVADPVREAKGAPSWQSAQTQEQPLVWADDALPDVPRATTTLSRALSHPKPKIYLKAAPTGPAPAAGVSSAPSVAAHAHSTSTVKVKAPSPSGLLRRIAGCESAGSPTAVPNYTAQNRWSTASGAYQFLDSTWAGGGFAAKYGVSRAMYAKPWQQDEAAATLLAADGTSPWISSQFCWG